MHASDREDPNAVCKGYYHEDSAIVEKIKSAVISNASFLGVFKSVECSIMDIADDIAYSTYDLEDTFKSGILKPLDLFTLDDQVYDAVVETTNKRLGKQYNASDDKFINKVDVKQILHYVLLDLFYFDKEHEDVLKSGSHTREWKKMYFATEVQELSRQIASNGYYRTNFTSGLIAEFLDDIEVVEDPHHPQLHKVRLVEDNFVIVEVLKNITYEAVIRSPIMQVVEFRGRDIVSKIFRALISEGGDRLMPDDYRFIYNKGNEFARYRCVCDFIAGMTDRYALEFYSRLFGEQGLTMHKPL